MTVTIEDLKAIELKIIKLKEDRFTILELLIKDKDSAIFSACYYTANEYVENMEMQYQTLVTKLTQRT